MTIRRFTILMILFAVVVTAAVVLRGNEDRREFPERLEDAIKHCRMKTYHDSFYDYEVQYPSFFEQVPDSLIDERGCSLFRYWDNWVQVELTARVLPLDSIQHQTETFIDSGQLYINGSRVEDYQFYAKYVPHRKFWFVLTLTFPDSCAKAVSRLVRYVKDWTVWEKPY